MNPPSRIGNRRAACLLALLLSLCAFCPGGTAAQTDDGSATVRAVLADPAIETGDETQFQIIVSNGNAARPPTPPVVDGLTITYLGPSSRNYATFNNGQFTQESSTIYVYRITAAKAGRFTIPGQDVPVGGTTLRTLPVTLVVQDAGAPTPTPAGQTVSSELILAKKTAYVGESFLAELRAYFGLNVNILGLTQEPILSGDGFSVGKFTPAREGTAVVEGARYRAAIYRTAVTGVKTGTVTVGPVETTPTVQLPPVQTKNGKRRGGGGGGIFGGDDDDNPFNQFFGGGLRWQPPQQVKVTAPGVPVEILPLPSGQPEGFSGGIGQFKLEVEAQPRRAQVGDPVTVRLILAGKGNFARINAPVLSDDAGLRTYPATAQFKADDDVGLSGTKTFEQVVIANGPRDALPAYHFDYLDPATGKYVALDTAPVAVKIEGSALPTTPAASTAPLAAATPAATPTPTPRPAQDILYIRSDPGPARTRADFLPEYRRPLFWQVQGAALAAFLLAVGALALRARGRNEVARRQAALGRQRGELQRALRQATTGRRDFYTAATRLAQLQAAGPRSDDYLSAAEIVERRRLDPQTAGSVQEIFHRRDELAYSGGQAAQEPVPADERRTVLATLETLGKNG